MKEYVVIYRTRSDSQERMRIVRTRSAALAFAKVAEQEAQSGEIIELIDIVEYTVFANRVRRTNIEAQR